MMMGGIRTGYSILLAGIVALTAAGLAFTNVKIYNLINPLRLLYMAPLWVMPVLLWLAAIVVAMLRRGSERPLAKIWRIVRLNRKWLLRGVLLMALVLLLGGTFSKLKSTIPDWVPYYADPFLSDLDRAILGTDAWRLTHKIAGPNVTAVLDRFYLLWFFIVLATQAWLNFARDPVFQIRGLLCFYGLWVGAGLIAATMLSSVGPCFYELFYGDRRYVPLMDLLGQSDPKLAALKTMTWLKDVRFDRPIGSGISAMPSLHVAMATLLAILLQNRFSNRWPTYVGYSYVAVIWFSSVHLGWHYATDGAVSILIAILLWWATGLLFPKKSNTSNVMGDVATTAPA